MAAWVFSNPPGYGPDEPAHYIKALGAGHGEFFGGVRPATSMVEVGALIAPEMIVEIEADAFLPPDAAAFSPEVTA